MFKDLLSAGWNDKATAQKRIYKDESSKRTGSFSKPHFDTATCMLDFWLNDWQLSNF